jgi:hypothetical protein
MLMTGNDQAMAPSMLISFRAENVRSFRDAFELSLLATTMARKDVPREVPWREDGKPIRVLPAAGVLGANASGKSNLLRVMNDMREHVLSSFRSGDPAGGVPRRPFRLDSRTMLQPSRFEINLILNGIRHEYGFVVDNERVIEEWAYRYPRGRAATLFHRDSEGVELGERNRATGRAVVQILRPNALMLSTAAAAGHLDLAPLYLWFAQNLQLAEAASRASRWAYTTEMLREGKHRDQVLELLCAADLGITDAHVRELDPLMIERFRRAVRIIQGREDESEGADADAYIFEPGVVLSHRGPAGNVDFDSAEESLGTLVWLGLAGPVIDALASGTVLLVDEIEASLHPVLVARIVEMFQSPESNPNGAQLIFNSHEASLLGDSVGDRMIGRDQVWFTEKNNDGATRLYSLADLDPRPDEAIGRRYLAGRYGAVPILAKESFTQIARDAAGADE